MSAYRAHSLGIQRLEYAYCSLPRQGSTLSTHERYPWYHNAHHVACNSVTDVLPITPAGRQAMTTSCSPIRPKQQSLSSPAISEDSDAPRPKSPFYCNLFQGKRANYANAVGLVTATCGQHRGNRSAWSYRERAVVVAAQGGLVLVASSSAI